MAKVDQYTCIKEIGEGAYGTAYLAQDEEGNKCVIKSIDVTRMSPKERQSCITEVQLLARLEHPFVVKYLDSFMDGNFLKIVMNYCADGDLAGVIDKRCQSQVPFKESQILRWLAQILMALKHIHSHKIIHRDIKSQNLLVDWDGRIRLADFGISKLLDHTQAQAKTFIGSPFYLSPELCAGKPYATASDMWAVGCVLYELATFKTPFHMATSLPDLCYKIQNMPIAPLPKHYSSEIQVLVDLMLHRDPRKRATAGQLLERPSLQGAIREMLHDTRSIKGGKTL
ncbi:serine threonine protein kinase [Cystoisospora suis]|uniref:non-specific serine/threonine protein kinase n=1 Tax=Cystoisospora suis TaxID=483139 RepID=A0A2C6KN23_9APIC|nr:serine threonine protein kinase [Cystoisospora suis]